MNKTTYATHAGGLWVALLQVCYFMAATNLGRTTEIKLQWQKKFFMFAYITYRPA